jgi:xanthine phosphoribosyltransferase
MLPVYDAAVESAALVASRARVDGDLIRVDDFLNHRVEPRIMRDVGAALAAHFRADQPDLVLTAEASGIPPGLVSALELDVPLVYARKYLGTGARYAFWREVVSPTKGVEYRVEVARRVLPPGRRVLIIDDFLSGGRTAEALGEITEEGGSETVGFGFVIEKRYQAGRERLERHGWRVHSLVTVASIASGIIELENT